MSEGNVEVVQASFEAWNAGDMDALRETHDPNVIARALEGCQEREEALEAAGLSV
jgi:ketosteroid isomerase-like protein